jgi:hypothetical protein
VRYSLKAARLQNPVLTNRNDIRGRFIRVSNRRLVTPQPKEDKQVYVAVIGGRKKLLPGEVSPDTGYQERSQQRSY